MKKMMSVKMGLVGALFFSNIALAANQVGDTAVYTITALAADGKVEFSGTEMDVVSKYTHKSGAVIQAQQKYTYNPVDEYPLNYEFNYSIDDLSAGRNNLNHCESLNGLRETLIVPAGKFETCKLPMSGGHVGSIWYSDVLFGKVQQTEIMESGYMYFFQLVSQAPAL